MRCYKTLQFHLPVNCSIIVQYKSRQNVEFVLCRRYIIQIVGVNVSPVVKLTYLEAGLVDRFAVHHACHLMSDDLLLWCIPFEHLLN